MEKDHTTKNGGPQRLLQIGIVDVKCGGTVTMFVGKVICDDTANAKLQPTTRGSAVAPCRGNMNLAIPALRFSYRLGDI